LDLTMQIASEYKRHTLSVPSYATLDRPQNVDIGNSSLDEIRDLVRRADSHDAQCIAIVCTNLPGTSIVAELERELGKPILDSISVTYWAVCRSVGVNPRRVGWGQLLEQFS